ncbi:hypothetical protein DRE_07503 [Drechslerella stenobrocha 248]|uniref:Uncharacterized protein n=1 Tax=Drechslerella stenobrocha 248 TaxID=1043628 RepID=W7HUI1_9PEZI|nr:hypothetical protein DRE_07503 [Drechslerella stenobrocha 248]
MRNLLKERLEHAHGIGKLRSTVRQDLFDEYHFLQQYPIAFEAPFTIKDLGLIDMAVGAPQLRHRPSVDLVQAAKVARQDMWRVATAPTLTRMASVDSIRPRARPAVDLMEAAKLARQARGERPPPVLISAADPTIPRFIDSPMGIKYTSSRPGTAHSGSTIEDRSRRGAMRAEALHRSLSVDHRRSPTSVHFDSQRPSTAGSASTSSMRSAPSSYRVAAIPPPPPPKDHVRGESISEMALKFPLPARSPPGSVKSPSPSVLSFSSMSTAPSRSHSRKSRTSVESNAYSTISNPPPPPRNEIQILEIVTSDGELHERYRGESDTERKGTRVAKPVIRETVTPKVHKKTTAEITRHHQTHEIRQHIQPIIDMFYEPEKHWIQTTDGQFVQVSVEELERCRNKYKYSTRVEETVSSSGKSSSPPSRSYTWKPRVPKDSGNRTRGHSA